MTIPLTGETDGENDSRNAFNRTLRNVCSANNRVLFDVADIESHTTNGVAQTYISGLVTNQRMYSSFAVSAGGDDWHLNNTGRRWVARGFYALGAALLNVDRDGDGISDGNELIAGTCPTNNSSTFKFENLSENTTGSFVIRWPSTSNRYYRLQRMTNLLNTLLVTNLLTNAAAVPPMNSYTDAPAGSGPFFYRVSVRQ
jgi:hypothetical protein